MDRLQTDPFIFLRNRKASKPRDRARKLPRASTRDTRRDALLCVSRMTRFYSSTAVANWWGTKRVDFALYCPEGLQQFPTAVLSPLFHVSYWESSDVAAFVIRQVLVRLWIGTSCNENIDVTGCHQKSCFYDDAFDIICRFCHKSHSGMFVLEQKTNLVFIHH